MSETGKLLDNIKRLREKRRQLQQRDADVEKLDELLKFLPQGHHSGLNADMVDDLHAHEIIDKAVEQAKKEIPSGISGAAVSVPSAPAGGGVAMESHITFIAVASEVSF